MTQHPGAFPDPMAFAKEVVQEAASLAGGFAGPRAPSGLAAVLTRSPSAEFRGLLRNYCATLTEALELTQVNFGGLAQRLGTRVEFLVEAAVAMNADDTFWEEVIQERIRRMSAHKIFRDATWEQLGASAQEKLKYMLDRGLIRDVGELLAIASTSERASAKPSQPPTPAGGGGNMTQVNVNFGMPTPEGKLPDAGTSMRIDLSPRAAAALAKVSARPQAEEKSRVIDGEMISVNELRDLLQQKIAEPIKE